MAHDYTDASVRPQHDLFRHANGAWLAEYTIPADRARDGAMRELFDQAEADVRAIVDEAATATDAASGQVADLYAAFLDEARADELGAEPIRADLAAIAALGGTADLVRLAGRLDREGTSTFFGFSVNEDFVDPTRYALFVEQGGLSLPDETYYSDEKYAATRDAFLRHLAGAGAASGAAESLDMSPGAWAEAVFSIEHEIAGHHWDVARRRDLAAIYNPTPRAELAALAAGFDVAAFFDGGGYPAAATETIVVAQPDVVAAVGAMLHRRALQDWQAWLGWQVVRDAAPYLSADIVAAHFDFFGRALTGAERNRERWQRGVALVKGVFGETIGKTYVERHFPAEAKRRMDALVAALLAAYRASIESLPWMTAETRAQALEKLAGFRPKIGYPEVWRDYSAIEVRRDDLLGSVRRAAAAEHARQLGRVGGPVDRDEWHMTPDTVNAYYNPLQNEIVFPAAILQPPMFDLAGTDAANFGAIGAVIGHEIGHGFDDQGSQFNGAGAMVNWWSDADRAAFSERTAALIQQYDALVPAGLDPGFHVNGAFTIGENIGDLGGLGIAYQALEATLGRPATGDEAREFFLSWARAWRTKARPEEAQRLLAMDPHSPAEFRCNQIVKNLDAFHAAFGTTPDDAMWLAPDERVAIW